MPPQHRSRPSRGESPHREPLSSTPSRSKYTFPVVNTPVLRRSRHNTENLPPDSALNFKATSPFSDANTSSPAISKSSSKSKHNSNASLPPRPPSSKPSPATSHRTTGNSNQDTQGSAKRKLNLEAPAVHTEPVVLANTCQSALQEQDSGVKVIIRVRPCNKKEELEEATQIVERNSCDSLSLGDQRFTFDHVAGIDASQQTMFEIVGLPLVENCLQGFNSSIFAYGQTGSGKTYTMWGATQDLTAAQPSSEERGLTLRVFERLFQRIKEEEMKNTDKQLHYQCRCSFLEIYNEQITDLLEPQQKALQVREDIKTGVYVENLTEEYVSNYDEVFCLMLKGLGNRKVGSTNMNLQSSRSHTLFTCVIESRCKSISDGVSSVRTSRMNLVDLAGSERQKLTGAAGERLKEAGNINRSLSQLGNLINILAEVSQSGKQRHIPYRDSRLTFLLQESLGGNAKLAMICAISPASSCKSETLSTLRFAQGAKAIKNKAVVNEETENDVNLLREQIRQLKDELTRMKSNESQPGGIGGYSTTWNARRSYNLLRMSLSRPLTLPHTDSDTDEEMEIDEDAVESIDGLNPSMSEDESTQAQQINSNIKHDETPEYDGSNRTSLKSSFSQSQVNGTNCTLEEDQKILLTPETLLEEAATGSLQNTGRLVEDATYQTSPSEDGSPMFPDNILSHEVACTLPLCKDDLVVSSLDCDKSGTPVLKSPVLTISPHEPAVESVDVLNPSTSEDESMQAQQVNSTVKHDEPPEYDGLNRTSLRSSFSQSQANGTNCTLEEDQKLSLAPETIQEEAATGSLQNADRLVEDITYKTSPSEFVDENLLLASDDRLVEDITYKTSPSESVDENLLLVSEDGSPIFPDNTLSHEVACTLAVCKDDLLVSSLDCDKSGTPVLKSQVLTISSHEPAVESVDGLNPSTSEDESMQAQQINSTVKHDEPPEYDGSNRTSLKSSCSHSQVNGTNCTLEEDQKISLAPETLQKEAATGSLQNSDRLVEDATYQTSPSKSVDETLLLTSEDGSPMFADNTLSHEVACTPAVCKDDLVVSSSDCDKSGTPVLKSPVITMSPHEPLDALQAPIQSLSPRISPLVQDATFQILPSEFGDEHMAADSTRQSSLKDKAKRKPPSVRSSLPSGKTLSSPTDRLAESLRRGLQILENHQKKVVNSRASVVRFSFQNLQLDKSKPNAVDKSIQTSPMFSPEKSLVPISKQQNLNATEQAALISVQPSDTSSWVIVAADEPKTPPAASKVLNQRVEAVLAGAIRRERAMEETLNRKNAEIEQLNRLVRQYKHERECNAVLQQSLEDKITRLESLMDGTMPTEAFLQEEWSFQLNEYKILQEKYDHHPEVTLAKIKQQRLCDDLEQYRNFYDLGEREALLGEISELRNQLQSYIESEAPRSGKKKSITPQKKQDSLENTSIIEPLATSSSALTSEKESCGKCEELQQQWAHQENEWMVVLDEMRIEIEDYKQLVRKKQHELEGEHRCADEMKEALQMAMEGHARLLDQYAELQEKHISLLAKHRKIRDGMADARKRAGKLGFLGAKWFEAQAAELVALKLEHEHERKMAKEQIEGLQAQVRDTADAVQAAGELLVRLKEAEEAVLIAQDAAALAEQDADKLHREIEKLKRRHSTEIATLQQRLMEARLRKSTVCPMCAMAERVKFQFVEVDAEEHEAALEAEHLAAETAAVAASASSSMPFHNNREDCYLGMLREEGEGDDDEVQVHQEEHFPEVEEEFNLGHSRVLEMDDRWYDDVQQCNY